MIFTSVTHHEQIAPRQLAGFMNELVMNEEFRKELEHNTCEVLAKHGVYIDEDDIPEVVKLPEMEELTKMVGEYLEREKFAFPSQYSVQMGFPLAFALVVVFVFIPANAAKVKKTSFLDKHLGHDYAMN